LVKPEALAQLKRSIRKEKIRWRSALPPEEARTMSDQIAATLKTLPEYSIAKTILFYVSAKGNEVDTHSLIRDALKRGVKTLVPVTDFDNNHLSVSELKDMAELAPARYGLLEPRPDAVRPTDPGEADVIIVPGVAFDKKRRRIGFGGGYYDRLLVNSRVPSIALAYEGQLVDHVPADTHDIPVSILITEQRTYRAPQMDKS
jgi:5-formyltetrahydrofolate cyclo-ligase